MFNKLYSYMDEAGDDGGDAGGAAEGGEDKGLLAGASHDDDKGGTEDKPVRPEGLTDAFWDEEKGEVRMESLIKSQADFQKQARAKHGEVPSEASEYKIELPEEIADKVNIPDDDPLVASAREIAFKHGMSKEAFSGFMSEMIMEMAQGQEESVGSSAEEKGKLGDHADTIIDGVAKWADNLVEVGLLSENERASIDTVGATADGIKALNKIRIHYTRGEPIPLNAGTEDGAMSSEEYYAAHASDKYATDPDYRAKVKEQGRRIFGDHPAGTSPKGLGVGGSHR